MSAPVFLPIFGPRDVVVAQLLGKPMTEDAAIRSTAPWVCFTRHWDRRDWPELWVDAVHDATWTDAAT